MIEIRKKLKVMPGAYKIQSKGRMELPFEQRSKSRAKVALVGGEEVALLLPRGEILRGGDLVVASDGRVIEVHASPEKLLHITCDSPTALAKAAYHLGNRHVAVQVGEGWMRIADDHVLAEMLRGLGAKVSHVESAFEPEPGAYAGDGHAHGEHGGVIHEYGEAADEHGHVHGPDCGHDHHGHGHDAKHDHDHDHKHDHAHDHAKGHAHDHDHGHDHQHAHGHDHDHAHDHGHDHKKVIAVVKQHGKEHDHKLDHDHDHDTKHDHDHAHGTAKKSKPH